MNHVTASFYTSSVHIYIYIHICILCNGLDSCNSPISHLFLFVPSCFALRKMLQVSNIYVIACIAVVGGGLFGFDIASLSAQLNENSYKCYFNQGPAGPPFDDNETCSGPKSLVQGGITAAMPAGSWLGALISGPLSDRIGRKPSIIVGCWIWYTSSWPASCVSSS